jgi:hypothetical protein
MQVKYIVAAIAAIAGAQAQATVLDLAAAQPEITVYITGASAQKTALAASVPAICDVANDVVRLSDTSTAATGTVGWYCKTKAITGASGKRTLVLYRSKNGSAAGINQLLSTDTLESQAETIDPTSCSATSGSSGSYVSTCTATVKLESTMALSDVAATEFAAGVLLTTGRAPSSLTKANVGLQGFGVVVNAEMYTALQEQNVADGLMDVSCVGVTTTYACQPSIRSTDYASLISASGTIKSAAALVPAATASASDLVLCRRVDTSGTQASSNIFFLNNVCGSTGFKGQESPISSADGFTASPLISFETPETGDAKDCLNNKTGSTWNTTAAGLRIGVVSLENIPGSSDVWKFVKIDGVSPNYAYDTTTSAWIADAKQKKQVRNGAYKFAVESTALWGGAADAAQKAVAASIAGTMKSSTSDLVGVLAVSGASTLPTVAQYKRNGNNCGELIKR